VNCCVCVYKAPSGKYDQFPKLFDIALQPLYWPTMELLMCGDINVNYLTNCYQKQQLSLLLGTYSMFYVVNFPTDSKTIMLQPLTIYFLTYLLTCLYIYITFIMWYV